MIRARPRVLVVDDDDVMRATLRGVFLDAGFRVEVYGSASALFAAADLEHAAVLLLDVALPCMSGLELQALLGTSGIDLPVMFLTGSADVAVAVEAMRAGAVDFLVKPFNAAGLVHRVERAFALCKPDADSPSAAIDDYAYRLATLTPREREVHDHMVVGMTSKQIALELGGSFRTIEIHRTRVMAKMAATHLADLVRMSYSADAEMARPRPFSRTHVSGRERPGTAPRRSPSGA